MSRRTNKRQENAKMIYSRLPDLFLSFPLFLSLFLPSSIPPSIPFPSTSPPRQVAATVFIVRLLCICSQSRHVYQLTVVASSSTMDWCIALTLPPEACLLTRTVGALKPLAFSPSHWGLDRRQNSSSFASTAYRDIGAVHHQMHAIVINAACAAGPTSCMLP